MFAMKKYFLIAVLAALGSAFAQSPNLSDVVDSGMDANTLYQLLLAEMLRVENRPLEASALYSIEAHRTPTDQLFERAVIIPAEARDLQTARAVVNEWIRIMPASALARSYLFQLNFSQRQYAEMTAPLSKFLELTPEADKAAHIFRLTRFFSAIPDKTQAAKYLALVLTPYIDEPKSTPRTKSAARITLVRAQLDAALYAEAPVQLRAITAESPESPDGWLLLGALELQENRFADSEKSFQKFLTLAEKAKLANNNPTYVQAYLGLAQLAEHRKDYAAAQNWLIKIEDSKELLAAQLRRASILAKQNKLSEARALIQNLPEQTLDQARGKLLGELQLLRDSNQIPEAIALLQKALAAGPKDADVMYELAMLHDKAKNYAEMESLLKQVIALRPNSAAAYNALGYSLADRGLRLEEAKELIEKALALTPNDAYIQDSLAWVLFRMGQHGAALAQLQAAYNARADAEIGAHMGEVLWQLNRKEDAIKAWREAQIINADNPTLLETMSRFGVKP